MEDLDKDHFIKSIVHGLKPEFDRIREQSEASLKIVTEAVESRVAAGDTEIKAELAHLRSSFVESHKILIAEIRGVSEGQRQTNVNLAATNNNLRTIKEQLEEGQHQTNQRLDKLIAVFGRLVFSHG